MAAMLAEARASKPIPFFRRCGLIRDQDELYIAGFRSLLAAVGVSP